MNSFQEPKKIKRRNLSSQFNINLNSDYIPEPNINISNPNIPLTNPNYVNCSIYPGKSPNDDLNEMILCPNCLSYQQKLNECNLLIQKLQNQLSKYNTLNNNYPNTNLNDKSNINLKRAIIDLKKELEKKNERISEISLDYDEKLNSLLSINNELEQKLSDIKIQNLNLNKKINKMNQIIKYKDDEIYKYKTKLEIIINKVKEKNEEITILRQESKLKKEDLENKYIDLSSNYNTLALSSGGSKIINYNNPKSKTDRGDNESDNSNEEDKIVDILVNTRKLSKNESNKNLDLIKSKSQKLYYESGSENNIVNLNKNFLDKKDRIKSQKMSSTQSSWMIPNKPMEIQVIQRDFENMKNKLDLAIKKNKKLNQEIIIISEELNKKIDENKNIKYSLNDLKTKNDTLNKYLSKKNNDLIRYQQIFLEQKAQIEKLKSLLSSNKNNNSSKIPYPSTTMASSKGKESSKCLYPKNRTSSNRIREFSEYDRDIDNFTDEASNKILSFKGNSQDMIDISDKDEIEQKKIKNLKSKSSSCSKNNISIENNLNLRKKISLDTNKDKTNLLTKKLNEKIEMIILLKSRIKELENSYKSMDTIKLKNEELLNKLKNIEKENNELSKSIEEKDKLINDNESKIKTLKKSNEEKSQIIQIKEKYIINNDKTIQNLKNNLYKFEKNLSISENILKEKEKNIDEKNNLIKDKDNSIILLQKKIEGLNEAINKDQINLKNYQNEINLLKDKLNKNDNQNNLNNNELIKQKKIYDEMKNEFEKEIKILKLDLDKKNNEIEKNKLKYENDKKEFIEAKINLELKIKQKEDIISQDKKIKKNYLSENEKLKTEITQKKEDLIIKEEELKKLKKELEQKEVLKNIDINTSINKSINEELKDKENEIQKQREIILNLEKHIKENEKEYHNAKLSLRIMTDAKENRDRQIDELNEDIESFKEKIEILEKEKNEKEEKIKIFEEEKNKINNELNDLKIELDKEKISSNEKNKQIDSLNNNIKELNNLINNINKKKTKKYTSTRKRK